VPDIKINNTTLSFNNIYYVNQALGSDSNDGSKSNPFQTLEKAESVCSSNGDAIVVIGDYNISGVHSPVYKSISYIGFQSKILGNVDFRINETSKFYCFIFSGLQRFMSMPADTSENFYFYNCVFENFQNSILGNGGFYTSV